MAETPVTDLACGIAHGEVPPHPQPRTLVAVFASPVATHLLHFARDVGYRTILVEPDPGREEGTRQAEVRAVAPEASFLDGTADVVVTDHHRPQLGPLLQAVLAHPVRWVGVIGSPRHTAPHLEALRSLGVPEPEIARVHRPIGLNIGSRSPAEIAIATLAGLIADRNERPGGFDF